MSISRAQTAPRSSLTRLSLPPEMSQSFDGTWSSAVIIEVWSLTIRSVVMVPVERPRVHKWIVLSSPAVKNRSRSEAEPGNTAATKRQ